LALGKAGGTQQICVVYGPLLEATGDVEGRDPDDEVLAELMLLLLLVDQTHGSAAADVHATERACPLVARQPQVDAVPVESVAARQHPSLLSVAARRYTHAAVHLRTNCGDTAAAGLGQRKERHHLSHRLGQHRLLNNAAAAAAAAQV